MPPASVNRPIGLPFLVLDTVDSTNNYAMGQLHAGLAKHGQAYFALHQFAGKGQRGKIWNAAAGENITVSIILEPGFPNNCHSFLLSASVALSCVDLLNDLGLHEISIKWPNDIYWNDRKAGGILIENLYRASDWTHAVIGIGINVNQTSFPFTDVVPVSVKQITGSSYDPVQLAKELCSKLDTRYAALFNGDQEKVMDEYNAHLYLRNRKVRLRKGNVLFETTIDHVSISGKLYTIDSIERTFDYGEIEWVGLGS